MASMYLIQKITRLAIQNFKRDSYISTGHLGSRLEQIKTLVNSITVADLNIDSTLLEDQAIFSHDSTRGSAPVTYMKIYEDYDVTICVFILKNGAKLPLHDHPDMTGILKVIHGCVSIQSYTMNHPYAPMNKGTNNKSFYHNEYQVIKHPRVEVNSSDPACFLSPNNHNLHEISTVGGLTAFLDILSPPYGFDNQSNEERDCHYFQEVKWNLSDESNPNLVYLESIHTPPEFWCDQVEYTGPPVNHLASVTNGKSNS